MNTRIIDDAYFGNNHVKYLYDGSELVWPLNPVEPVLPTGPGPDILLDWISNGDDSNNPNVYFDLGMVFNRYTAVDIKYRYSEKGNQTAALFGAYADEKYSSTSTTSTGYYTHYGFYLNNGSNYLATKFSRSANNHTSSAYAPKANTVYKMTMSPTYPYNNDSDYSLMNYLGTGGTASLGISGYFVNSARLYLFAVSYKDIDNNYQTKYFAPKNTRIYYIKVYGQHSAWWTTTVRSDVMYRFLIPVLHYDKYQQMYVPCFYDKISNTYFYNRGTDNLKYQINGDYLLDYIQRDTDGWLMFDTGKKVDNKLALNIGFEVTDRNHPLEEVGENWVIGTYPHGFIAPRTIDSSLFMYSYVGGNNVVQGYYDYGRHELYNHHCDHVTSTMYSLDNTTGNGRFYWLSFPQGSLPPADSSLAGDDTTYSVSSNIYTDSSIYLFGDAEHHALPPTKIYYADFENMAIGSGKRTSRPGLAYIPVLHKNTPCFYDVVGKKYIYNMGTGWPAYDMLGYTSVIPDSSLVDSSTDVLLNWISNGDASATPNVYFDTGFAPSNITQVEVKYSYTSAVNNTALFGVFHNGSTFSIEYTYMLRGSTHSGSTEEFKSTFYYGRTGYVAHQTAYNGVVIGEPSFGDEHSMRFSTTAGQYDKTVVYFDDVAIEGNASPYLISSNTYHYSDGLSNIYVFAANDIDNNCASRFAPAGTKIHYMKIYDNGQVESILYRFLIPVLHWVASEGKFVPCFYDKVSGQYFYNQGTDPVTYEIKGDYLLDCIERTDSGDLRFRTNTKVESNDMVNLGFSVGNDNVLMTDLDKNFVAGAKQSTITSKLYGLYFPLTNNSTTYGFYGVGSNENGGPVCTLNYNMIAHSGDTNHTAYFSAEQANGKWANRLYYLDFQSGELPTVNTTVQRSVREDDITMTQVLGQTVSLFSDGTNKSQETTKIHYYDAAKFVIYDYTNLYGYNQPKCSYIPVIHNDTPCFYDLISGTYIYNVGSGVPGFAEIE